MVRKLTAALLGVGVMVPGLANALGLGEIKLNSHLSEPLDAEIQLVQTRELTESEIIPSLASPDDFSAAGVERFHHLTDMKFEVVVNNNGRSYIKVKSRKPIKEPFVNFLVEVHWPAGRLLREYTLLLDPPNFSLAAPQPVQPAVTAPAPAAKAPSVTAPVSQPAVTQSQPASAQPAVSAPSGGGKTYGPTKSTDSLWSIAKALRPSTDISIQQTMIAIQQLNPDAFINGNINLLKKGKILRGPSVEQARELSSREAINLVNQQNQAWKDRVSPKADAPQAEVAQIDTSGRAVDSFEQNVSSDEGRLRLVSAETDAQASDSGQGGASGQGDGPLRERAELAEETADQFRLENDDLKSKVNELEEQVGTGEKLLDLKDDQIAALQARLAKLEEDLAKARAAAGQAPVETTEPVQAEPEPEMVEAAVEEVVEEPEVAEEPVEAAVDYNFEEEPKPEAEVSEDVAQAEPQIDPSQAVQVESSAKEVVVEQPEAPKQQTPKQEPTFVEQLTQNPLYMAIVGGGIAVLAVLGLIIGRRRNDSDDELDEALVEDFSLNVEEPEDIQDALEEEAEEVSEETVPETADVLGEADIYIAYGRFPQAIEMLEKAAEAEPQRGDIRIKLLETSIEAKDQDVFMRHYQEVQELGVPSDIDRANALKEQFGGLGDADMGSDEGDDTLVMDTDLGETTAEDASDFSFDLDDDETVVQPAASVESDDAFEVAAEEAVEEPISFDLDAEETAEEAPADDEFSLDFDVDSELESAEEVEAEVEFQPEAVEEDTSLDFDLDLDAGSTDAEDAVEIQADEESLDADFSLDLDEDLSSDDGEVSFGEAEESLDFELSEDSEEEPEVDAGAEFDLDLDSDDSNDVVLEAAPVVEDEAPSEDVIDSDAAAKLADELDLDGDFDLDLDAGLAEAEAEVSEEAIEPEVSEPEAIEPESELDATVVAVPPAAPAPAEAANSEEELDFLSDADEASTKLDLARAYIDMGDREGAKDILDEVLIEGNDEQQGEAKELLARLD